MENENRKEIEETLRSGEERGAAEERRRVLGIIITLVVSLLAIEAASMGYLIYMLGLYIGGRYKLFLFYEFLMTMFIVPLMVILCLRWARGAIAYGKLLMAGEEPSNEEASEGLKSVFAFARNGAILFVSLYIVLLVGAVACLHFIHGYNRLESWSILLFKGVSGLNQGIIMYYAVKIIERSRIEEIVDRLLGRGVYDFDHYRIRIRSKIFMIIFAVVAYLLASSIFMGITQAGEVERIKLSRDLEYWGEAMAGFLKGASNGTRSEGGDITDAIAMLGTDLSPGAKLVIWDRDGNLLSGDDGIIDSRQKERLLSSKSNEFIYDYKNKIILYGRPIEDKNIVIGLVGRWGTSALIYSKTRNAMIALLLGSIILTMVATFLLVSDINNPLARMLDYLHKVSTEASDKVLDTYSDDEIGDFIKELARTTSLLESKTKQANGLIRGIEEAAVVVKESATGVQAYAEEQAAGINDQAAAVEEALAAANEIVTTAREIAKKAEDVRGAAERNTRSCLEGEDQVAQSVREFKELGQFVSGMSESVIELGGDIRKISGVMKLIEGISVQISLLALNAQIEAAGAEEAETRFTVVAEEVRRLAENTMAALKYIESLVQSTIRATNEAVETAERGAGLVEIGAELAEAVRDALAEIGKQAELTAEAASKITIITNQQKTASEQMADTISGLHENSSQIRDNTDEVLKSTEKLNETATELNDVLSDRY